MDYTLIRSRRKTLSLQITPAGQLIARAPNRMSKRDIDAFVESKRPWIEAQLARLQARPQLPPLTREQVKLLSQKAAQVIPERVAHFASLAGVTYGRITIRSQYTRWGSCSAQGNLNFNCLLLCVPPEVLDYVVIHELCHRKQLNHSPAFWSEVETLCPEYKTHRKWLKENGGALIRTLP